MNNFFKEIIDEIQKYRFLDPQKAYDCCCKLLEHSAEYEEMYEEAYARLYMGDTLFSLGKLTEAIDMFLLAEKIQKQYGYEELLMKNYNITAIIYITQGDELLALDYYYKAIRLAKKQKDYNQVAIVHNNIGSLLYNLGEKAEAAQYFEKAWQISQKHASDHLSTAEKRQLIVNISHKYLKEGKYHEGKKFLDENLPQFVAGEIGIPVIEACVDSMYLNLYYYTGDYQMVYQLYQKFRDNLNQLSGKLEIIGDLIGVAHILIKMKDRENSEELLYCITQVCQEANLPKHRIRLCEVWMEFCETFGDRDALDICYEHYYQLRQQMKSQTNEKIATALANRQQLERQRETNSQLSADNKKLVQKSETDELTGISNRYGLNKKFVQWSRLAQTKNKEVCMGLFDIDYFKVYNDRYGHLNGDSCLQAIAQIVKETAADNYFVSRYGGDEFIVLGLGKTDEEIKRFADALFARVKQENMPFGAHPSSDRITISMGLVNKKIPDGYHISDMVHEADEMLYQAKKNGKNQWFLR